MNSTEYADAARMLMPGGGYNADDPDSLISRVLGVQGAAFARLDDNALAALKSAFPDTCEDDWVAKWEDLLWLFKREAIPVYWRRGLVLAWLTAPKGIRPADYVALVNILLKFTVFLSDNPGYECEIREYIRFWADDARCTTEDRYTLTIPVWDPPDYTLLKIWEWDVILHSDVLVELVDTGPGRAWLQDSAAVWLGGADDGPLGVHKPGHTMCLLRFTPFLSELCLSEIDLTGG